ncbi:cyanoexosortase A [Anthocerotibacter panamensis]|uniref:cyanoexosortase A n=1 Tax=Anthocerotibacter panamensis TaxID=2857077 RepID=UPI001C403B84|nr:cyanoexosortase A [Anthocerotibacter panamensis]
MQAIPPTSRPVKYLTDQGFWLACLAVATAAFNLYAVWNVLHDSDTVAVHGLFWGALGMLVWRRRQALVLESGPVASLMGSLLLVTVILKCVQYYNFFTQLAPLLCAFGLALIASGFSGLKQYTKELLLMAVLVSTFLVELLFAGQLQILSLFTARFSYMMLWYTGSDVVRQGTYIRLPTGAIDVYQGCSGFESMMQLLRLSVLFLFLFPTQAFQKVLVPVVGLILAFSVNGIRVALMALLVAANNQEAFKYWHEGDGSNLFSVVTMLLFGFFCRTFVLKDEDEDDLEAPS